MHGAVTSKRGYDSQREPATHPSSSQPTARSRRRCWRSSAPRSSSSARGSMAASIGRPAWSASCSTWRRRRPASHEALVPRCASLRGPRATATRDRRRSSGVGGRQLRLGRLLGRFGQLDLAWRGRDVILLVVESGGRLLLRALLVDVLVVLSGLLVLLLPGGALVAEKNKKAAQDDEDVDQEGAE